MLHHERVRPPPEFYPADEWNIIEKGFHPEFLAQMETILALGNGFLGMRGTPDEGGPAVENATLVNGFYETGQIAYAEDAYGFARTGQTICNVIESKSIKLFVDDEPFWLPHATLLRCERRLDMRAGTLDREILWETPAGKQVLITSRRIVSFAQRHVAAIAYRVSLLNTDASIVLSSEMALGEARPRRATLDPRMPKALERRVLNREASYSRDQRLVFCHSTQDSGCIVACATDSTLETTCPHRWMLQHDDDSGRIDYVIEGRVGVPIELQKLIAYHISRTSSPKELCDRAERTLDHVKLQGFRGLASAQAQYMSEFWSRSDVQIHDIREERTKRTTVETQQAIRFNLFHILQACARAETAGVPAKGLTGSAYEGHHFWDTEIYLMPFLCYTAPQIAKNVLTFRYKMLDQARDRAKELGHQGAMYPWRTISGEEASAYYAAGTAQYHINADIAFAVRKYVQITGDEQFLREAGAEMLVESARLWIDLGFYSPRKGGKFCLNAVTGPDEYKTVVNNNAYTNLMARENLRYAHQTVLDMRDNSPEAFSALARKTSLGLAEVEEWSRAAENMYVPYDHEMQIIPQDDSFLDKERWDFENTPRERYPLLLFYHPLDIYRKQVIKQADVILAMFLLDGQFSLEEKKRNFAFYDGLTTGDSSLSSCVEAIMAAQIGEIDKAIRYGMAALLMDLADVGGNVKDGCHIASMGGTWMTFVYGLGGLKDHGGTLSFWPHRAPQESVVLKFSLAYRGRLLGVEIGPQEVQYTLRAGDRLTIRHEAESLELTQEQPIATKRVSERQGM